MICHCEICGEPFTTEHKRKYCEECRKMMAEISSHIRSEEERTKYAYEKYMAKSREKRAGMSISEIVNAAREEGLTYGQYVAKYGV